MSYFLKKELLMKWLLLTMIASVSACSKKVESPTRRSPTGNANATSVERSAASYQAKKHEVKKANGEFDTYQEYESIESPASLKEMKKNRRRPVLNVQELNSLMDKNFKKPANIANDSGSAEKASCTEDKCELKKVINYNKSIAKRNKSNKVEIKKEVSASDKNHTEHTSKANELDNKNRHIVESKNPEKVKKANVNKNTSGNKNTKTSSGKSYNHSALPPVSLPQTINSKDTEKHNTNISTPSGTVKKLKEDIKSVVTTNNSSSGKKDTSGSKASSGKNTSGLEKAKILQNIKNSEPVFSKNFLDDGETQARPMPPMPGKMSLPTELSNKDALLQPSLSTSVSGKQLPPPPSPSGVSGKQLPPPPSSSGVSGKQLPPPPPPSGVSGKQLPPPQNSNLSNGQLPAPQFNKEDNRDGKLKVINKVLINYYYRLKSKISSLFSDE